MPLQVRSLRDPYPLIQTVVLRNARRILQSNNAVIVALENAVYGLFPVPLGAQVFLVLYVLNFYCRCTIFFGKEVRIVFLPCRLYN